MLCIKKGRVYDGVSGTLEVKDLFIEKGKVVPPPEEGVVPDEIIDASGQVVAPGFVDIHMHEEVFDLDSLEPTFDIADKMLAMGVTTAVAGNCGSNRQSVEDFFTIIEKHGAPIHYASFVGHNSLRKAVGITDRYRSATPEEMREMNTLLRKDLARGVLGLSMGLEYEPGISYEEMRGILRGPEGSQILLAAHFRSDADRGVESVEELIRLSRETDLPMQISHLGSCTAYGMMKESLEVIERARKEGLDIQADCYPYAAFSTTIGSAVFDPGCFDRWGVGPEAIQLTEGSFKGRRCDWDLFEKVRKEAPDMLVVAHVMLESDVKLCLQAPFVSVASDGVFRQGQGHPRGAGTFARVLGPMVRKEKLFSLEEALYKMTRLPADRLGLTGKGRLMPGADADVVIFDEKELADRASFDEPTLAPVGIDRVLIAGRTAYEKDRMIDGRLGTLLKKERKDLL